MLNTEDTRRVNRAITAIEALTVQKRLFENRIHCFSSGRSDREGFLEEVMPWQGFKG